MYKYIFSKRISSRLIILTTLTTDHLDDLDHPDHPDHLTTLKVNTHINQTT